MITQLTIQNFTLVDKLVVDFTTGMTVITGETGAGKSMLLDALELTLGSRADPKAVRNSEQRAELTTQFNIKQNKKVTQWLQEEELDSEDEHSCTLRRTITSDGRSKAYINGYAAPLSKLKQLSQLLLNLYGQHEHQYLLKRDAHRDLVDNYGKHQPLLDALSELYRKWQTTHKSLKQLLTKDENQSRQTLLAYQIEELNELNLVDGEYEALCKEHKQLSNQESLLQDCQKSLTILTNENDFNLVTALNDCQNLLGLHQQLYPDLLPAITEMLQNASIQIEEASNELEHFLEKQELDPQRLFQVEQRLDKIHDIARKHHVKPQELPGYHQSIQKELDDLAGSDERIKELKESLSQLEHDYQAQAETLGKKRATAGDKLAKLVTKQIKQLGMPEGQFEVHFTTHAIEELNPHGTETIEFMISTNPGRPMQPLNKVASGGELSRIALAIQVITAQTGGTPTLIFDEIDVGIGGATAEIVGKLLRSLGNQTQVICITHQPQVAASGHQHLKVMKETDGKTTHSEVNLLKDKQRIEELARMLGGVEITKNTLKHAGEMLAHANV